MAHQWNPADYARHSQGQERWAKELFGLLSLQPSEHVLDLGCGDGRITAQIAALVPQGRVVGVDRSAEMVKHASAGFPASRFPNLSFLQADAAKLPFNSAFDVVFSNAVLHWVKGHLPVLSGIARSLRPGGRCVLQMGGKGNGSRVISAFDYCLRQPTWQADLKDFDFPYGFYHPVEYRKWLLSAGLHPDAVELIEKDMIHSSREAFTGWLRTSWLPYCERVAGPRREDFLEAVTDRYLDQHPCDATGQVHVSMMRLQVLAHKPASS
jgi:trans-aconitate methyltransferase